VPDESFMAVELLPNSLQGVHGVVEYPKEFFEKA
jgi:predicted N-acetyltransferase YhbS